MMVEENENIDQLFREKLWNIEETPPLRVWNNIELRLGHTKKNRGIFLFVKIAAGFLLFISLGLGYYFIQQLGVSEAVTENKTLKTEKKVVTPTNEKISEIKTADQSVKSNKQIFTSDNKRNNNFNNIESHSKNLKTELSGEKHVSSGLVKSTIKTVTLKTDSTASKNLTENKLNQQSAIIAKLPVIQNQGIINLRTPSNEVSDDIIIKENLNITNTTSERQNNPYKEWIVGGQIAPLYAYREISTKNLPADATGNINKAEDGIISYAGGLNVKFAANRRLSFQSGLYYTKMGQAIHASEIVDNSVNSFPSSSFSNKITTYAYLSQNTLNSYENIAGTLNTNRGDLINTTISAKHYYEYLEIPFILRYKIIDRTIDFNVLGGVSTNFLLNDDLHFDQQTNNTGYLSPVENKLTKINYSGSIGLGIEYPISSRFIINMEPIFKYYLNSINENSNISKYPYTFGIYTGMSYVF